MAVAAREKWPWRPGEVVLALEAGGGSGLGGQGLGGREK